jgi:hypothetical protein
MKAAASESEFIRLVNELQSASAVARHLGIAERNVHHRIVRLEGRGHRFIMSDPRSRRVKLDTNPARLNHPVENGTVLVASDAHYMPDEKTQAHLAFVKLIGELKPKIVVMNGDVFDGGGISRFPRAQWTHQHKVKDELEACQARLTEIEDAAKGATLFWPMGNHDARFESRLSAMVPEFEGVKNFSLKDFFPAWKPCWSLWVNENTVIKHRFKGGLHATHNNTLNAGKTMVTGHLHSLKVTPFSDYNGTRYGVDTGTLAEPYGEQFTGYTEDNPVSWVSGFAVLTYHKGYLLPPEVCAVTDVGPVFRGQIIKV